MPRADYKRCKRCNRHTDEAGPLSHARYCGECGSAVAAEAALELANHSGAYFQRWRGGMAASVGGVLLDAARESA